MRRFLALGMTAVALLVAPASPPASASVASQVFHHKYSTVYVADAAPHFPVRWAVQQWDLGTNVHVVYGPCRNYAGCVHVVEGYYGLGSNPGWTAFGFWPDGTMNEPVTIRFNLSWTFDTHNRYQTACHEVGTSLGLAYRYRTLAVPSCMYLWADARASIYPSPNDRWKLNQVYPS
jgi:hypothetical protein